MAVNHPSRKARRARPEAGVKAKALAAEAEGESAAVARGFKIKAMDMATATTNGVAVQAVMDVAGNSDGKAAQMVLRRRLAGMTLAATMLQIRLSTFPTLIWIQTCTIQLLRQMPMLRKLCCVPE